MINGKYTVFGVKDNNPDWAEVLLVDTENESLFNKVLEIAPRRGYKITRIYKPNTILSAPDFANSVNV